MEIQSGHSELFIISQVSAVEGCSLSGVPLYTCIVLGTLLDGNFGIALWPFTYPYPSLSCHDKSHVYCDTVNKTASYLVHPY